MFKFIKKTAEDIKTLHTQGAESIAIESIKSMRHLILASKAKTKSQLIKEVQESVLLIKNSRPTEPCLRNSLYYLLKDTDEIQKDSRELSNTKEAILKNCTEVLKHFTDSRNIMERFGENKIKNNMTIFTHCHSSSVVAVIKKAKLYRKSFFVLNTETRPLYQGRTTAKELSELGIPVEHYIDSAARVALKKSDIVLLGCDAITKDKIYNKIGSEMFIEIACRYKIPIYICTDSWKFSRDSLLGEAVLIETRPKREIWQNPPENVEIVNPAFERINPKLLTGIISELGILTHKQFIKEAIETYPYLFKV